MQKFSRLTDQERRDALCNAIKHKCRHGISSQYLKRIVNNLNVDRTYFIKVTQDHGKFLNIATEEFVVTNDRKMISYVVPFYGDFRCGRFFKHDSNVFSEPGSMSGNHAAAALKTTICSEDGLSCVTFVIVIYEGKC